MIPEDADHSFRGDPDQWITIVGTVIAIAPYAEAAASAPSVHALAEFMRKKARAVPLSVPK